MDYLFRGDDETTDSGQDSEQTMGGYELLSVVGKGGMGVVYRAYDDHLGREVALKTLSAERASASAIQRFNVEAAAAARLEHPNTLPVYDFGVENGRPYYTMRLVEGAQSIVSLRDCRDQRQVAQILAQVAGAVDHAHRLGILHRDLKPNNVLLEEGDTPYVADFGLAKIISEDAADALTLTLDSEALGSPSYMAPEQACGDSATTATDVYGIGAILYDVLTGKPPHQGATTISTIEQVRAGKLTSPSIHRSDIPLDLETICLKAMAHEPSERYESAGALGLDLQRFARNEPIVARPPSLWKRAMLLAKRHPIRVALSCLVVLATLLGIVGVTWQWQVAVTHREIAEAKQAETLSLLYHGNMILLDTDREVADARVQQLLQDCAAYPDRGFEWYYWQGHSQAKMHRSWTLGGRLDAAAFSPDGKTAAIAREDGEEFLVDLWGLESGQKLQTFRGHGAKIDHLLFIPGSQRLVVAGGPRISVWDLQSGQLLVQFPHHPGEDRSISTLSLVPGAPTQIATASFGHTIMLHEWPTGAPVREFVPIGGPSIGSAFAFSPDGKRLATHPGTIWDFQSGELVHDFGPIWNEIGRLVYAPNGREIAFKGALYDVETGAVTFAAPAATKYSRPALSPDGNWLALAGTGGVELRNRYQKVKCRLFDSGEQGTMELQFSPDGNALLSVNHDNQARLWHRSAWDDSLLGHGSLTADNHRVPTVDFSPDGSKVVTGANDRCARVWETDSRKLLLTVELHQDPASTAVFLPNGREVLTASNDGVAKVWDATTGEVRLQLTEHTGELWCAAVSHDGRFLVTGGSDKWAIVWDAVTGSKVHTLVHEDAVSAVAFSPDDTLILTGGDDRTACLWNAETGELQLATSPHGSWVAEVRFLPDGKRFLTASQDHDAKLWDTKTGEAIRTFEGHTGGVGALAVSPDGRRFFTGSMDGTIRVWDPESPRHLLTLRSAYGPVHALDLSPDGHTLISAAHLAATFWEAKP